MQWCIRNVESATQQCSTYEEPWEQNAISQSQISFQVKEPKEEEQNTHTHWGGKKKDEFYREAI